MNRRTLLTLALVQFLARRAASEPAARFLKRIDEASRDLKGQPLQWQLAVEQAARAVDLDDLRRSIDFDKLSPSLAQHDSQGGDSLRIPALHLHCAAKLFCLRRGDAITPHGHRNMASMHLVLGGELHVRHFQRLEDEREHVPQNEGLSPAGGSLILQPSIDRISRAGDATSVSPDRDNIHWFVARTDRAYTFDCIVSDLKKLPYSYAIDLVDPDRAEKLSGGRLRAKVIGWDESLARYGRA